MAGPTLAYFLHRSGYDVTVVERAPARRTTGHVVGFSRALDEVFEEMGILDRLRAHDTKMGDIDVVDGEGAKLGQLPAGTFSGVLEVHKPELTGILHEITGDGVEYVFDDSITALSQHAEGVKVEFERGPAREFDLVFGADGLYSPVRRLAFTESDGTLEHLGISTVHFYLDNYLGLERQTVLHMANGTAVILINNREPDRLMVSLSLATGSPALDRSSREEQEQAFRTAFAGQGWEVPRLLKAMSDADRLYVFSSIQVRMETWARGRVALVGDAGYCAAPISGRGTSQAMLGARSIARNLVAAGGEHEAAFAAYEAELRPYVAESQEIGRKSAQLIVGEFDQAEMGSRLDLGNLAP
ncbi:FAD-dependent monooxygenase [Amycolatopsis jejuensis]|uniref:FAD-dependent monooxygenase n=1 Tax=Amycolatopsis jejuensis TaxID=330084 RepID=UPI0007C4C51F|nr:FAD-dependent monooxygenase [Amycolatopsis jejuensis]